MAPYLDDLPLEPWGNYLRDLAAACERAGIARVTPNDLRRTFASWLLQQEVPPMTVAKMMGHRSTDMVMRVYGQLGLDTHVDAIKRLPRIQRRER